MLKVLITMFHVDKHLHEYQLKFKRINFNFQLKGDFLKRNIIFKNAVCRN